MHVGRTAAFSLGLKEMDRKKLSVQILGNRDVVATSLDEMLARLLCNQFTIYPLLILVFILVHFCGLFLDLVLIITPFSIYTN